MIFDVDSFFGEYPPGIDTQNGAIFDFGTTISNPSTARIWVSSMAFPPYNFGGGRNTISNPSFLMAKILHQLSLASQVVQDFNASTVC